MAVYNAVAWWYRRERHLGANAVIYGTGLAWEAYQTARHFRKTPGVRLTVVQAPPAIARACQYEEGAA